MSSNQRIAEVIKGASFNDLIQLSLKPTNNQVLASAGNQAAETGCIALNEFISGTIQPKKRETTRSVTPTAQNALEVFEEIKRRRENDRRDSGTENFDKILAELRQSREERQKEFCSGKLLSVETEHDACSSNLNESATSVKNKLLSNPKT